MESLFLSFISLHFRFLSLPVLHIALRSASLITSIAVPCLLVIRCPLLLAFGAGLVYSLVAHLPHLCPYTYHIRTYIHRQASYTHRTDIPSRCIPQHPLYPYISSLGLESRRHSFCCEPRPRESKGISNNAFDETVMMASRRIAYNAL